MELNSHVEYKQSSEGEKTNDVSVLQKKTYKLFEKSKGVKFNQIFRNNYQRDVSIKLRY
jgi:hypothetical protein